MLEGVHEDEAAVETVTGAPEPSEAILRAEEMVDQIGERVGHFVTSAGHSFLRFTARAREEAEDMWAEAQSIRNGEPAGEELEDAPAETVPSNDAAAPNADEALAD